MKHKTIVFDIDGTLADISHRVQYVRNKPKDWKKFNELAHLDKPIEVTCNLFKMLWPYNFIIVATGRSKDTFDQTNAWLMSNGLYYHDIYMRKSKDYREDSIIKVEFLKDILYKYEMPAIWFEDRSRVVHALRNEGVRVFQVDNGDF